MVLESALQIRSRAEYSDIYHKTSINIITYIFKHNKIKI